MLMFVVLYVDVCVFVGVGAIRQIASEVVQYVMDLAGQSQGQHVTEADQLGTLTEPDLLTVAMVHQQHRAEVRGQVMSLTGLGFGCHFFSAMTLSQCAIIGVTCLC